MTAGLARGLDNADAARFGFLLATPPILAAGLFKLGDLTGPNGNGIRGAAVIAAICAAVTAVDHRPLPHPVLQEGQPAPVRDLLHPVRRLHDGVHADRRPAGAVAAGGCVQPKRTLPLDRARAWARSTKSSRLVAARNSRVTSLSRAFSERRSSSPCLASSPKSTVAAMS